MAKMEEAGLQNVGWISLGGFFKNHLKQRFAKPRREKDEKNAVH